MNVSWPWTEGTAACQVSLLQLDPCAFRTSIGAFCPKDLLQADRAGESQSDLDMASVPDFVLMSLRCEPVAGLRG